MCIVDIVLYVVGIWIKKNETLKIGLKVNVWTHSLENPTNNERNVDVHSPNERASNDSGFIRFHLLC